MVVKVHCEPPLQQESLTESKDVHREVASEGSWKQHLH